MNMFLHYANELEHTVSRFRAVSGTEQLHEGQLMGREAHTVRFYSERITLISILFYASLWPNTLGKCSIITQLDL